MTRRILPRVADWAAIVALCAAGLLLVLKTGSRGFFPFDQSIIFDGSYRIVSGQIPYKDFVMPFGPVTFWLQAIFFKFMGVTYFAYVFGAAAVNALAVLAAVAIVRLLFRGERLLSYVAGILTAVWFYPPFGTPWVDQTAFFLSYCGIVALLAAIGEGGLDQRSPARRPRRQTAFLAIAGVLAFLSILGKQNAGTFMLPAYPVLIAVAYRSDLRRAARALAIFAGGLCASLSGFIIWLLVASDISIFNRYVIAMPSELGRERLTAFIRMGLGFFKSYFGPRAPLPINVTVAVAFAATILAMVVARRKGRSLREAADSVRFEHIERIYLAGAVGIYLTFFQYLFMNSTLNQQANAYAFLGPIVAIAAGVGLRTGAKPDAEAAGKDGGGEKAVRGRADRRLKAVVWIAVALAVGFGVKDGAEVGMSRMVQDIYEDGRFDVRLDIEGLESLRWQDPMVLRGFDVYANDLTRLVAYLREARQNFFEFPDFTILYGILGVPSPQPLLWFHEGVTFPEGGDPDLDSWIVRDLEKNRVGIVVIEQVAWLKTGERLDAFPKLKSYIYGNFQRLGQMGIFAVYAKAKPES